jgi:hypothetical protein
MYRQDNEMQTPPTIGDLARELIAAIESLKYRGWKPAIYGQVLIDTSYDTTADGLGRVPVTLQQGALGSSVTYVYLPDWMTFSGGDPIWIGLSIEGKMTIQQPRLI